ncbi:hypothetical protein C1645_778580 [Glomus cerebriforme]|uniref:Uncharacterized protein n=1 Tax=Glomus cerebriforme TaxID=658196 RepID=A0A397SVE1_9GLOM|nr:hypothetical protein C1645_778580 [Glomus cerebriforme]
MSNSRLNYQIVWSPHEGSNSFLLGSNNDLKLYEYNSKGLNKLIFMSPAVAAMAPMKCFTWSPDTASSSIAAGFANGKILLVDLRDESHTTSSSTRQQQPYVVLNSKNAKSCNNVAFSSAEPRLLATGFEKGRNDYGLLIWDVEKAKLSSLNGDKDHVGSDTPAEVPNKAISNGPVGFCRVEDFTDARFGVYEPPLVPKPLPTLRYDTPSDAIYNFGLSENVNSISWFPTNSKQLVSGMSGKYLRIFDLRLAENPTITIPTKAVFGVKTDPYNDHRFASFEDGYVGNICLWDDRKTTEAVLSVSTETRPVQISFSTSRLGLLASLSNDASYISLYDIKETTHKVRHFSMTLSNQDSPSDEVDPLNHINNGFGGYGEGNVGLGAFSEKSGVGSGGGTFNFGNKTDEELDIPVLWKSRRTQKSSKSLVSFAWIPTISTTHSHRLLAMNKEQIFETITLEESPSFDWEPRGNISIFGLNSFTYDVDKKKSHDGDLGRYDIHNNTGEDNNQQVHEIGNNEESNLNHHNTIGGHKHRVSLDLKTENDYYSGNRTPRPGDSPKNTIMLNNQLRGIMTRPHDNSMKKDVNKELLMSPLKALKELQGDISVVMRKRAREGYSMDCRTNEEIVRDSPKLKILWNWIANAEKSTLEGRNSDFGFQGIHSVWIASTSGKKTSPMSTPKASPPRPSEKFDQVVDANELSITASTSKLSQRKLALTICGWGFGKKELEETLQKMEREGSYEKAAGWALFHGKPERAIAALNNSKGMIDNPVINLINLIMNKKLTHFFLIIDERLKLVSAALAGYAINNHDTASQANSLWNKMCRNLSHEMRDPYLRAMFSYIASGDWLDVLQEKELSLQDRIGIALRFLDDEELNDFLHITTAKVVSDGDIDGVVLTGLTPEGVSLFENYINNTCDVQTASLALSFCVPKKFKDPRVNRWIESYRMLLDQWEMFHTRAKFDIARGKHMVSSTSSAADMVPPQVYVRCNFCCQSVSHSLWIGMKKDGRVTLPPYSGVPGMMLRQKPTSCPGCRRPLPRCSICLLSLGTPAEEDITANLQKGSSNDKPSGFDLWFTWCQTCRHGGHAIHMLQWFQKHKVCPVSECTCECEIVV